MPDTKRNKIATVTSATKENYLMQESLYLKGFVLDNEVREKHNLHVQMRKLRWTAQITCPGSQQELLFRHTISWYVQLGAKDHSRYCGKDLPFNEVLLRPRSRRV